jgi:hypothetical protein
VNEEQRQRRRRTFGQTAGAYDRVRPGYPPTLIDHLLAQARINTTSRILEIGCGTGQLTRSLLRSKTAIKGLKPSSEIAALAAHNFAAAPQVKAAALRSGGTLAILINAHPTPYTGFFSRGQEVCDRIVPEKGQKRGYQRQRDRALGARHERRVTRQQFFYRPTRHR